LAENREKFSSFVVKHGLKQPENGIAMNKEQAVAVAEN
jgi:carbamoyl-phosphate synthase large subunit